MARRFGGGGTGARHRVDPAGRARAPLFPISAMRLRPDVPGGRGYCGMPMRRGRRGRRSRR